MLQIIALTQFVFLALGSMGVTVLLKASGYPLGSMKDYPALSLFLMQNSVWLLLVPILWSAYAYASQKLQRGFVSTKVCHSYRHWTYRGDIPYLRLGDYRTLLSRRRHRDSTMS